jgi:hypothetical protein
MERMKNPAYRVIGLVGGAEESFEGSLLTLDVEDSYEFLPRKIQAAFRWIHKNYPETEGIFKTDDDIFFADQESLTDKIITNKTIPYWGIHIDRTGGGTVEQKRILMANDKTIRATYPSAIYSYGAGYWISKQAIPIVCSSTEHANAFLEDVTMGYVMNRAGHIPRHVQIQYQERPRINSNN